MPHLYDKAPPAFAKDPWAWDYTRDRIEGNTGVPYDQWEGKHFAGSAAMYKNVVKKYAGSIEKGVMTVPKECLDCGQMQQHYADDYVCKDCRDAIESAGSYEEAAATISQPEALDDIREQLYKALGHDKKDAKAGKSLNAPVQNQMAPQIISPAAEVDATAQQSTGATAPAGRVSRNYKAMSADKLQRVIAELEANDGDAAKRVHQKGEDIFDNLEAALRAQQENA